MGFDPRIQLVHIDDALEAIRAAVRNPVPGAVNVAGPGTIGLARMIRLAGKRALPIAAPLFGAVTSTGQRLGLDSQSEDFERLLRYGRGVDTRRLTDEVGYTPRHSTVAAVEDWVRHAKAAA
jgi:UDP-glucose 4-epimerase